MNAVHNSIYIFMLFLVLFGFAIMFSVTDSIYKDVTQFYDDNDIIIPEEFDAYENTNYVIRTGMEFLLVLSIVILFVSSAVQKHTLESYITAFLSSLIVTAILIFVVAQLYNSFTMHGSLLIDFSIIPDWFLDNIVFIFFLNIVAGLVSFVFASRSQTSFVMGGGAI